MRKLFIGALVGALALAVAAIAVAATNQNYTQTFTKKDTKTSTGTSVDLSASDPDNPENQQPTPLRKLTLTLPKGTKVDYRAARRCKASDEDLQNEGPSACPAKSNIGTGKATARFHTSALPDVHIVVTAFNAKKELILYFEPDISNPFVLRPQWEGKLKRRPKLVTEIPPNCLAATNVNGTCVNSDGTEGEEVVLNTFQLDTLAKQKVVRRGKGKKRRKIRKQLVRTPKRCNGSWTFKADFEFKDATQNRSLEYEDRCRQR